MFRDFHNPLVCKRDLGWPPAAPLLGPGPGPGPHWAGLVSPPQGVPHGCRGLTERLFPCTGAGFWGVWRATSVVLMSAVPVWTVKQPLSIFLPPNKTLIKVWAFDVEQKLRLNFPFKEIWFILAFTLYSYALFLLSCINGVNVTFPNTSGEWKRDSRIFNI